jgi:outer membrane protein assembly factor BamB
MKPWLLLLPAFLTALVASGADWTQFRGPGGSGASSDTGLPTSWSEKENLVWRTPLPGPGTSSPIVVGQRVYLTCYTGYGLEPRKGNMKDLMRHLVCINRDKGDIVWVRDFKPLLPESDYDDTNETQHGYSSSTLASDGNRLYAFFGKSGSYCLDLEGKEIWRANVGSTVHGWGSSNSPVLYQDLVIVNASIENNSLVALDKNTGKVVWSVEDFISSRDTPVLVDLADGSTELVVNDNKALRSFDPKSGKQLWRVTGFGGNMSPSVVANKGVVYLLRTGSEDGGGALAIKAGGRGDVTQTHVLWRARGSSGVSSPVYYQGRLYWAGSIVACLDAASGNEVYRGRLSGNPRFYASALAADGKIYCVSRFTGTYVVSSEPPFKELAHNTFADDNSRTNASPIVSAGCLLLRTDRYLYCLGKKG